MAASNIAVEWMKQDVSFNSNNTNFIPSLTTDKDGNILFTYTADGVTSGNSFTGFLDIVICKMNSAGTVQWVKQSPVFNTLNSDQDSKIVTDNAGNVYVAYAVANGTVSGGQQTGGSDIAILKMNPDGDILWIKQNSGFNTIVGDNTPSITVDSIQNVYIAYETLGVTSGNSQIGGQDIAIAKLDTSGNLLWIEQRADINITTNDFRPEIRMCNDNRYFYLTLYQSFAMNPPVRDIKVVKYDTLTRSILWGSTQGSYISTPADDFFPSFTIDSQDNIYIAYRTFGASSGNTYGGGNEADMVITKISSDGIVEWITQNPTPEEEIAPSIVYDPVYDRLFTVFNRTNAVTRINEIFIQKINKINGIIEWEEKNEIINNFTEFSKVLTPLKTTRIISSDNKGNIIFPFSTLGIIPGGVVSLSNSTDVVLMKLNTSGQIQWTKQDSSLNTPYSDDNPVLTSSSSAVYLSYNSNSYVTTAAIDPNSGSIQWTNNGSSVNPPPVVNTSIQAGGSASTTDSSGNIYVTYYTSGVVSAGTQIGGQDIVLYKMDASGTIMWVKQLSAFNTPQSEFNSSVAVDNSGYVYLTFIPGSSPLVIRVAKFDSITGNFLSSIDIPATNILSSNSFQLPDIIGKSSGFYISYVSGVPHRTYIQSYDSSIIAPQWTFEVPGIPDSNQAVSIKAAGPNIYLSYTTNGIASGQVNAAGNNQDIVIAKIIDTGSPSLSWIRQQPAFNTTNFDLYSKIAIDSSENIYVTYNTFGTTSGATSNTITQVALVSYDTNGTYRWITQTPLNPIGNVTVSEFPSLTIRNDELFLSYATQGTVSGGINIQGPKENIVIVKFGMPNRLPVTSVRVGDSFLALENMRLLNSNGLSALVADPETFNFSNSDSFIDWGNAYGGNGVSAGSLFRDLKRTVTVSGSNGNYLYKFRKVQLVNGTGTEGVGGSSSDIDAYRCGWICTWSAYGNGNA